MTNFVDKQGGSTPTPPDPNLKRIWMQSLHDANGQIRQVHGALSHFPKTKTYWVEAGEPLPVGVKIGDIIHEYVKWKSNSGESQPLLPSKNQYVYYYDNEVKLPAKKPKEVIPPPSGTLTTISVGTSKFNPPPHSASRTVPPTAFSNYSLSSAADVKSIEYLQKANRRGFFYQDIDNAYTASGDPKTKNSQLWGFQFMYNPTTISHTQANANFDITNTADISNQLTGSQTFSVSIFLNRVMDMSILATDKAHQLDSRTADYSRALTEDDAHGILTRGTEYDLEFLYRVINGEPKKGPTMDKATSDFGFLAPAPIWFRLHDNFKYKVVITGITVNHVMFTEKMIPILSEVSIGMMRIPTPTMDSVSGDTFLAKRYTNSGITESSTKSNSKLPVYGAPSDTSTDTSTK